MMIIRMTKMMMRILMITMMTKMLAGLETCDKVWEERITLACRLPCK